MPKTRATSTFTITRAADTDADARQKLTRSHERFVLQLIPQIASETGSGFDTPFVPHEFDFYQREPDGKIKRNANGRALITPAKLESAVEKILRNYYNDVCRAAIRQAEQARAEALIGAAIINEEAE